MEYEVLQAVGVSNYTWRPGNFFAALAGFNLRYKNGDHKVRYVSAGGTTSEELVTRHDYNIGLYDRSSIFDTEDDMFVGTKMINLGAITEEFVMGTFERRGTVSLPIAPIGEEDSFILRGFTIEHMGDNDHNIRKIGVRLNPSGTAIDVTFQDNSPNDDKFRVKVVFGRVISERAGYNMETQFIGPFTEEKEFTLETTIEKEYPGTSLLTGFHFEYLDTDHFIKEMKIDPETDETFKVKFTDNEEDNPVKVIIDYIGINEVRPGD